MRCLIPAVLLMAATGGTAAAAETITIAAEARSHLAVTVYGDGLAFVRDSRDVQLPSGASRLAFDAVSREMVAGSAWLETSSGVRVVSLDSDFDLLTPDALLRRAVGQQVLVVRAHPQTGEETSEPATLLSAAQGIVVRYRDRIETVPPGRIAFPKLPEGLAAVPTLSAAMETTSPGRQPLTLSYLTGGLGWSADYLVTWDERTHSIAVACRARVTNTSGTAFARADLGLIAGQLNRVAVPQPQPRGRIEAMAAPTSADASPPERESLADLHLYRLAQPVTLEDQQTRQFTLFEIAGLPVTRTYISEGGLSWQPLRGVEPQATHPRVRLTFTAPAAGKAEPMPAGTARIYTPDSKGEPRLVGEDSVPATPAGGRVDLEPGEAFDISVRRRQTDFVSGREPNGYNEASWQISVENAKPEPVDVRLIERLAGDWKVLSETASHEKVAADRIAWTLSVPARGTAELAYRVRTQR